jgi:glycine cleavage system H protein
MTDFLTTTVDKFTFKVATDRRYTDEGLWAKAEGDAIRIGVSDYLQQRSGDVAFAEVKPAGTALSAGDEVATLETIKVNTSLTSPVRGTVRAANPALETTPELINSDPYGDGWLAFIAVTDIEAAYASLLTAEQYFEQMKEQAEQDAKAL